MKKYLILTLSAIVFVGIFFGRASISHVTAEIIESFYGDPDMPSQLDIGLTKEEYVRMRSNAILLKRGIDTEAIETFDPTRRMNAIHDMERQEAVRSKIKDASFRASLVSTWSEIGPNPIPNGQTNNPNVIVPVSGRVTAIDVHPTNANIAYVGTAQGGLYRTLDGGTTWTQLMDSAMSLSIGAVTIDPLNPSVVFVGTGETNQSGDCYAGVGLYRIDNADTNPVLNGPFETRVVGTGSTAGNGHAFNATGISKIVVDPANDNRIFVGSTWSFGGVSGEVFPVNTGTTGSWGLFFCENARAANPVFSLVANAAFTNGQQAVTDMVFEPGSSNNLLVGVKDFTGSNSGVFRSTNAAAASVSGNVAPALTRTLTASRVRVVLAINKVGSTATALAAREGSGGNIVASTDGGATWPTTVGGTGFCGNQCNYDMAMAIDPSSSNNIFIGGAFSSPTVPLQKSVDSGVNFSDVSTGLHADTHAIVFAPSNPTIVWEGNDGGIWRSTNSGSSWTNLNNSTFKATQFESIAVHPTDPNFTIGGTQDNGTNFYRPNGTWTNVQVGDGGDTVIDQNAADTTNVRMFHTYFNSTTAMGYERVTNVNNANSSGWNFFGCGFGGITANGMTCTATATQFYAPMERGPGNPNTLYFGSDVLYRSSDGGTTMTKVSQEPITSGVALTAIGISPQNDNVRIVGLRNGGVFATTNGASTLTSVDPVGTGSVIPDAYIARTAIDPQNPNTAYVTLSTFGVNTVWKTTNLSNASPTWAAASGGLPQIPVNGFVIDPQNSSNLYAGTDIGVYMSADAGATWTPFGVGLPRVAVFDMAITNASPRLLRIVTHGRGMWQISLAPAAARRRFDFDGDGRSDLAIFRPSDGNWWQLRSTSGLATTKWGQNGDILAPADFDGDGKTDLAIFRTDTWWILRSNGGSMSTTKFGAAGDVPVPGDYDGDGIEDLCIFRPSTGSWWRQSSSNGQVTVAQFGQNGDVPMIGDYDGDGKNDLAVFRPSTSVWYVFRSSDNQTKVDQFGTSGDVPVSGDFNGDNKADLAVYRPSTGTWYVARPTGVPAQNFDVTRFGTSTDVPVPADYDGDGKTDIAIYRSGQWWVLSSSSAQTTVTPFGLGTDKPVESAFAP